MSEDDVTLGELSRRLSDTAARLEQVANTFGQTYLRCDLYQRDYDDLKEDIKSIQERASWLFRTVVTAIILAGVSALFAWIRFGGH